MAEKRRKKEQATMLAAGLAHSDADTTADTPRDSPPAGIKAAPPATPEKRQREEDAPIETKRTKLTHTKVKTPRREVPNYVAMFEREMADIDMADLSGPLSSSSSNDRILSADLTGYHMEASLDQLLNS
ncbi:hypothetical protein FBU59_004144 [Linderina macrospora]|uniref:Uncharacterized protein n=1 Tax=Linderina macrospora TaxID=4868 RepID=A0ACC1J6A3_9FUNG|nr:hypothetical protein FBU59_004144 [Linderina macrospora]